VTRAEVMVVGGGHNGLVCAGYLARAGLDVLVLEASATPGGCIHTVDLPGGRGRLEVGAYEHGGLRAGGVAADLELESRFGLRFHLRDQVTLAPATTGRRWPSTPPWSGPSPASAWASCRTGRR
jgi:beta-carotene ketolase (CrtO type)